MADQPPQSKAWKKVTRQRFNVDLRTNLNHFCDFFVLNIDPLQEHEPSVFSIYWTDLNGSLFNANGGSVLDAN